MVMRDRRRRNADQSGRNEEASKLYIKWLRLPTLSNRRGEDAHAHAHLGPLSTVPYLPLPAEIQIASNQNSVGRGRNMYVVLPRLD